MCAKRRHLHQSVPEQLADHRQAFAQRPIRPLGVPADVSGRLRMSDMPSVVGSVSGISDSATGAPLKIACQWVRNQGLPGDFRYTAGDPIGGCLERVVG